MSPGKAELRQRFLEKRNAVPESQARQWSSRIREALYSLPEFQLAKSCLIYVSKGNETFTHDIIEENLKRKRVCVPFTTKEKIIPSLINFFDELKPGAFGILEPKRVVEFPMHEIDVVIVPGVAFDEKGNRLGYGRGYFDRFLRWVDCLKIALAYEMQIADRIPQGKGDVKMDFLVTEQRVIKIRH
jgi:5-formyltetrahydrofolate cyclo-ligase